MNKKTTSCFKVSDTPVQCPCCKGFRVVKNGFTKTKKQQYYCKACGKRFLETYTYHAYRKDINEDIVALTKEGMGIRSTARFLKISATTLLKRIIAIAPNIKQPPVPTGKTYEVDELCTFVKNKSRQVWIVYVLDRETKTVPNFNAGARTNKTLNVVLETLRLSKAKRIYTDGLQNYRSLIEEPVLKVTLYSTNHIERKNLTLRTHLKRLSRRTICFSRSLLLLACVLKIYFWS